MHGPGSPEHFHEEPPRLERAVDLEPAYEHAERVLEADREPLESFIAPDGANRAIVARDCAEVERLEAIFRAKEAVDPEHRKQKMLATATEAALKDGVNEGNMFGSGVRYRSTTKFDDYVNKYDGVLEFSDGHLGIGVDVTFSAEATGRKLQAALDEIDKHKLGTVRYYRGQNGEHRPLRNLPRVIVRFSPGDATRVARDWHEGNQAAASGARLQVLRQMAVQLRAFRAYAARSGWEPRELLPFDESLRHVDGMLSKVATPEERSAMQIDEAVLNLSRQLEAAGGGPRPGTSDRGSSSHPGSAPGYRRAA